MENFGIAAHPVCGRAICHVPCVHNQRAQTILRIRLKKKEIVVF